MDNKEHEERVSTTPPEQFDDDEAAREFGRQLAMDSLLGHLHPTDASEDGAENKVVRFPLWNWIVAGGMAAAVLVLGLSLAFFQLDSEAPSDRPRLSKGWMIEPVGAARFSVLDPGRVRLEQGELLVFSKGGAKNLQPLVIETANAEATASGTRFYVGYSRRP